MNIESLILVYEKFQAAVHPLIHIKCEEDYVQAIEVLESILELAGDDSEDHYSHLIDLIGKAINDYEEAHDEGVSEFLANSRELPQDISLLRVLIDQHRLTYSDLPEIGGKSMVSKVMNGNRTLNRGAIEKIAARFGISPRMFFD